MSSAFLAAVRGSHQVTVQAIVTDSYQEGVDPDGTEIEVVDGTVELDGTAEIRSTVDLVTDGTRMWPSRADSALAPYGNEVFIRRGIRLAGGSPEWVSLGYHRINSPEQAEPVDGPIRIDAVDRMASIIDGRLTAPRQFGSTTTYGSVVEQLVTEVYPAASIDWDDDTEGATIGRSVIAEEDRYGFLADMVQSLGKIWYWDHRGRLQITDPPDPADPVFDVDSGPNGVLVSLARRLTREGVYNAVVASGESTDTADPVRGIAVDANPSSPTFFYGRFGPVPRFLTSPFITTTAQAATAAASLLRQQLGLPFTIDFSMVPNVALEPFDPVRVRVADGARVHTLQRLGIPLAAEQPMTGTTREQTVVLIGTPS